MTEDEIYQVFLDTREERKVARKLPFEPSRMDFAMKVAEIAYERGCRDGWKSREEAEYFNRSSYPTGFVGDPQ
jgi:hypothetical protein